MAKTNETATKTPAAKTGSFFTNLWARIVRAFKDMVAELRKVTWPSKQELINYSLVVLAFMAFMGIVIGVFDGVANQLVRLIVGNK